MIRHTLTTTLGPIDRALDFLDNVEEELASVGQAVMQEIKPELLDELQDLPPKRAYPDEYPIEFTSDKQRKAYFATDGFGRGIPTVRDNTLINSWEITGQAKGNMFSIITRNLQDWSKYVVGSLAKDISRAARFQQNFHQITGWKLATIPVQEWQKVAQFLFKKEFLARWKGAITGQFKGRAFTTSRRNR